MARITVEDCLKNIDNQFDLVMVAAKRARRLANGQDPLVEIENDKPTVIALREIAEGLINAEILEQMSQPEEDILSSEEAEELLASTPLPGAEAPAEAATETPPASPAVEIPAEQPPAAAEAAPSIDEELARALSQQLSGADSGDEAPQSDAGDDAAEPDPENHS